MKGLTRKGDVLSAHPSSSPNKVDEGSFNVLINGKEASFFGAKTNFHNNHIGTLSGDNHVLINGKSAQKVDDPVSCGIKSIEGSFNVLTS